MIRVQEQDFEFGTELAAMTKGNHDIGGVCSFVGLVRDIASGETVSSMTLEHYPEMTEKALADIEAEARGRRPRRDPHRSCRAIPAPRSFLVRGIFWGART